MTDLSANESNNNIVQDIIQDINSTSTINDNLSDVDKMIVNSITNTADITNDGIDFKNIWNIINPKSSQNMSTCCMLE